MKNSSTEKKCEGCRHITNTETEWCYMFEKLPYGVPLPCGQHDIYAEARKQGGKAILERMKG